MKARNTTRVTHGIQGAKDVVVYVMGTSNANPKNVPSKVVPRVEFWYKRKASVVPLVMIKKAFVPFLGTPITRLLTGKFSSFKAVASTY